MANAPQLAVQITADTSGLMSGLQQAVSGVQKASTEIQGHVGKVGELFEGLRGPIMGFLGLLGGGAAFKEAISSTTELGEQSAAMGRALGTTADEGIVLSMAIKSVHGNVEDFMSGASKVTKTLQGNEQAIKDLGVATRDSNGHFRSMPALIADINGALGKFKEGTDRDIEARKVYGKSYQEMLRFIQVTPEVMDAAREHAEKLHLLIGPEGAAQIEQYRGAMVGVDESFEALKVRVGLQVLPALTNLATWFNEVAPAAITKILGWMQTLGDVLSLRSVQWIAALVALKVTFGSVGTAALAAIQTINLQWSLGMMNGISSTRAFASAMMGTINPIMAAVVAIGALVVALDWLSKAEEREIENGKRAHQKDLDDIQAWGRLSQEAADLDTQIRSGKLNADALATSKNRLSLTTDKLIQQYPNLLNFLKDEAGHTRTLAEAIKMANDERERSLAQSKAQADSDVKIWQAQVDQRKQWIESGKQALKKNENPGDITNAGIIQGNIEASEKDLQKLQGNLDLAKRSADQAGASYKAFLDLKASSEAGKHSDGGAADSESRLAKLKEDLEKEAQAYEEKNFPAQFSKTQEAEWLESHRNAYGLDAKEQAKVNRMLLEDKRAILKQSSDAEIESMRAGMEAFKHDASARRDILISIQDLQRQRFGVGSEQDLKAGKDVSKLDAEIEDEDEKVRQLRAERRKAHAIADLELQTQVVEQDRQLMEISDAEAIQRLAAIEERKYQIELKGLQERRDVGNLDRTQRAEVLNQISALEDKHAKEVAASKRQMDAELLKTNGWAGALVALKTYVREAGNTFQTWGQAVQQILSGTQNAFANFFSSILKHGQTARQKWDALWKGIANSVVQALTQMAAQKLVAWGVDKVIDAWDTARGVKKKGLDTAEAVSEGAKADAVVTAEGTKTAARVASVEPAVAAAMAIAEASGVAAGAAVTAAAAETWEAYAYIPYAGAVSAMAQIAEMEASVGEAAVFGNALKAGGAVGAAEGAWFGKPTLAVFAEAGQPELAIPETSFQDYSRNLSANIMSEQRRVMEYDRQGASYARAAMTARAQGDGGSSGQGDRILQLHNPVFLGDSVSSMRAASRWFDKVDTYRGQMRG